MVKFFEIQKDDILPTEDITIHKTLSGTELSLTILVQHLNWETQGLLNV